MSAASVATPPALRLKNLEVGRNDYIFENRGVKPGEYGGKITFDGPRGEVLLHLTPEQTAKMLAICAEAVVQSAQEVSGLLVDEVRAQLANSYHPTIA